MNTELYVIHFKDYDMKKLNANKSLFVLKTTKF